MSLNLPTTVWEDLPRAVRTLQAYFAPVSIAPDHVRGYTGGQFDRFHPSGPADSDEFTADDLVAVTLLSVRVPAAAALAIMGEQRSRLRELLRRIGSDRDLALEPSVARSDFEPAWELSAALRELPGVGPTIANKLMARKRPRLLPIYDAVINQVMLDGSGVLWVPLHQALIADDRKLHHRLIELRTAAGLPHEVSAIRVLDVLAWMQGKGYDQRDAGPDLLTDLARQNDALDA